MTELSEAFKEWHAARAAEIIKNADALATEYIKDGLSDSIATHRTAIYKVLESVDETGWDAWQSGREQALLDAMNATLPFGKVGIVIASAIRSLK